MKQSEDDTGDDVEDIQLNDEEVSSDELLEMGSQTAVLADSVQ